MKRFLIYILLFSPIGVIAQNKTFEQVYHLLERLNVEKKDDSLLLMVNKFDHLNSAKEKVLIDLYKAKIKRFSGNTESQIRILNHALEISNATVPDSLIALIYDELSISLKLGGVLDRKKAFEFIDKSIAIKRHMNNKDQMGRSLIIKSNIWYAEFDIAKYNNKDFLDSTLYYIQLANEYVTSPELIKLLYRNEITLLIDTEDFENAIIKISEVLLELAENDHEERSYMLNNLSSAYIKSGEFEPAKIILDTLLNYNKRHVTVNENESVWVLKIDLADSLKNIKEGIAFRDSMLNFIHSVHNEINYQAQDKYRNDALETKLAIEQSKILKNRIWILVFVSLFTLACLISFYLFRMNQIRKEASKINMEKAKMQASLDATKAKMDGEQTERESIAGILHDQVASLLTAASLHLKAAIRSPNFENGASKTEEIIQQANERVRAISHQLVSPVLLKFGIEEAIINLTQALSCEEMLFECNGTLNNIRINKQKEIFLYNSVAELMQNSLKHSNGSKTEILLKLEDNIIHVFVFDNGKISLKPDKSPGLGLTFISHRAEAYGGTFKFVIDNEYVRSMISIPIN